MKLTSSLTTSLALLSSLCAAMDMESLPWSDLRESIGGGQLIDVSPQKYLDECYPEFTIFPRWAGRDHFNLIEQPSGLCMFALFCGFEQCAPEEAFLTNEIIFDDFTVMVGTFRVFPDTSPEELDADPAFAEALASAGYTFVEAMEGWMDPTNPAYNIPAKVLFPRNAGDVVAAVEFAKMHGVEISVKNSGHSYTGSSTKADTLLLNMRDYERYAFDDKEMMGIVECTNTAILMERSSNIIVNQDLSNQACVLATARGKPAFVRVGGGENFDKAYRAVQDFNERDGYKYHIVGGAVGTVSPMGWTWQGGLAGTTGGRKFGFGVDQVLQIEAVLPNGEHVRFGPTSWEDSEGFMYPKTTKVSGVCNKNPDDEEANWVWEACPEDLDLMFDDLWFAFRGGGGGTWGVVLSVYLQLHEYVPLDLVQASEECNPILYNSNDTSLLEVLAEFNVNLYLDPDEVNLSREQSNACGNSIGNYADRFWCYSNEPVGEAVVASYRDFISKHSDRLSEEAASIAPDCLEVTNFKSYTEWAISVSAREGQVSTDLPTYLSDNSMGFPLLLPKSWILENKQALIDWIVAMPLTTYWAFGGDAEFANDQANSLSTGHREAGAMVFASAYVFGGSFLPVEWEEFVPKMYDLTSGVMPSHSGYNHMGPNGYGPLKDDPLSRCPVGNLTNAEAESLCYSAQEIVFGTETLARLESIKSAIDPNGMFDCFRCIGNAVLGDEVDEGGQDATVIPTESKPEENEPASESTPADMVPGSETTPEDIQPSLDELETVETPSAAASHYFLVVFAAVVTMTVVLM